jgi:hypothetical protein
MVLQSNPRIRNAKSNEGKAYSMGGVTYKGSGRKAGTGRTATTRYNVKFLKAMGACCKSLRSDEAILALKVWHGLVAEYNALKAALAANDNTAWTNTQTNTEFLTVPAFTDAAKISGVMTRETYANRPLALTQANGIGAKLETLRAAWANKPTGNTNTEGDFAPKNTAAADITKAGGLAPTLA